MQSQCFKVLATVCCLSLVLIFPKRSLADNFNFVAVETQTGDHSSPEIFSHAGVYVNTPNWSPDASTGSFVLTGTAKAIGSENAMHYPIYAQAEHQWTRVLRQVFEWVPGEDEDDTDMGTDYECDIQATIGGTFTVATMSGSGYASSVAQSSSNSCTQTGGTPGSYSSNNTASYLCYQKNAISTPRVWCIDFNMQISNMASGSANYTNQTRTAYSSSQILTGTPIRY